MMIEGKHMGFIINESAYISNVALTAKDKELGIVKFTAILQEADKPNRNGRIYSKAVLEHALNSPYVRERLRTRTFLGEANHPSDNSVQRQMTVDLTNVAFRVNDFFWEGNLLKGHCETAATAVGRDMAGLIEQGCQVAFSLRAQGNVHQDPVSGNTIVDDPIQICSYDWVLNPSHDSAYLLDYCCESTQHAMLYGNRFANRELALLESANIFENGELIPMDNIVEMQTIDYRSKYNTKLKRLSEMYIPERNDVVKSIDLKETVIENKDKHLVKHVLTEDYLVKDIRSRIVNICEADILNEVRAKKIVKTAVRGAGTVAATVAGGLLGGVPGAAVGAGLASAAHGVEDNTDDDD